MRREREFTRWLADFFAPPPGRCALGIGDDAAVVVNRGKHTVVACDPVVEGVHFTRGAPLRLVGRKVVNRNLADLAAMGARFDYAVVSVLWPHDLPSRGLLPLLRGVRDAVQQHGGYVVGGDTGNTLGPLTVTVTVLGHLVGRVLRRDGARAYDAIHVTAPLGGSIAGHHLRFEPPLAAGARLARSPAVGAAMDISDGLVIDLSTMLEASSRTIGHGLCACLTAERVPISAAARRLAHKTGKSPLQHAFGDGEDHALLFTMRRGRPAPRALGAVAQVPIGVVMRATPREAGAVFVDLAGQPRQRVSAGYEHVLGSARSR